MQGESRRAAREKPVEAVDLLRDLDETDPFIARAIADETTRQERHLNLIAAENFVSRAVLSALGSVLANKYAEGYPGRRYYGGCAVVDVVEAAAIERAKGLFGAEHINVQPHSGTQANMAVYMAALKPGDLILGPDLAHGGHMTAGDRLSYAGTVYSVVPYGVRRDSELIDLDAVRDLARRHRPRIIIAGGSAFPRIIDFKPFRDIAREVDAVLLADVAHPAGMIAAGLHPSPVGVADFVTTTTHETLRGPRGGLIMCDARFAREIDRAVIPGVQGGPFMHAIAAKAVALQEASGPAWPAYQARVVRNAQVLATALLARGYRLVTGGTDTHLILVDVRERKITGRQAQEILDEAWITVNKNPVPFDPQGLLLTSGIRLGTPAVTSRGMGEAEMEQIAVLLDRVLSHPESSDVRAAVRKEIGELTSAFPLYRQCPERKRQKA